MQTRLTAVSAREFIHALVWCKRHLAGQYAITELPTVRRFVRAGDTCLDVGAHAGSWTRPLSKLVKHGRVYAFEALPYYARALRMVVRLLGLTNVLVLNKAVSDNTVSTPVAWKDQDGNRLTGNTHIAASQDATDACVMVDGVTLDSLLPKVPAGSRISFVKIDVEGAELMALRGAVNLIKTFRPVFYIEIVTECCERYGYSPNDLFQFFAGLNYMAYAISPSGIETSAMGPSSYPGKGDVLFVPAESKEIVS